MNQQISRPKFNAKIKNKTNNKKNTSADVNKDAKNKEWENYKNRGGRNWTLINQQ